ncbi:hypothetical protein K7887_22095 (plasmid) [Sutcliffiella horikoshii]|uniref:hypothetical protein n=1 Tax=Sutcliffiella horikoshii TaxID=79883 RepID=UPI001CC09953|nr:hypothetical protein [Sutcliffiella horikoshii]UAL49813.1 hypothetical protein K7887_22095 [Sutcliffiella horikoshii]
MFEQKARQIERIFLRRVNKQNIIFTAKGKTNYIIAVRDDKYSVCTEIGNTPFTISRKAIRKAINYFIDCKTITRRSLEKYSNFTSSLLGILIEIFKGKVMLRELESKEIRLSLLGTRLFASGLEKDPNIRELYKKLGGKHLLLNYFHIRGNKHWKKILDENFHVIIDSGAFSVYRAKQKMITRMEKDNQLSLFQHDDVEMISLEEYASFINKEYQDNRIKAFINLDVIGDPVQTQRNFKRLNELCPSATIWPVWQINDSLENIETLVDEEHEVICIGGLIPLMLKDKKVAERVLSQVLGSFPTVNFHCLGLANRWLWNMMPFSVDTTAYLNARKSEKQRKIYNVETGERVNAPSEMSTISIIAQNLSSLLKLEKFQEKQLRLLQI